ncbi:MAG TPA: DUF3618 domain-containing protein [Marmoricola sp.]
MADKKMSAIEQEIEATRERLASTIDELAYRASPKTIAQREVETVKGFFVDESGAPRTDNIVKVVGGFLGVVVVFAVVRKIAR